MDVARLPRDGPDEQSARAPVVEPIDLAVLAQYLRQLVPLAIGADPAEVEALLERPELATTATRWAQDPAAGAIYIVKTRDERNQDEDGQSQTSVSFVFSLSELTSFSNG